MFIADVAPLASRESETVLFCSSSRADCKQVALLGAESGLGSMPPHPHPWALCLSEVKHGSAAAHLM